MLTVKPIILTKEDKKFLSSLDDTRQNIANMMAIRLKEFNNSSVPNLVRGKMKCK